MTSFYINYLYFIYTMLITEVSFIQLLKALSLS